MDYNGGFVIFKLRSLTNALYSKASTFKKEEKTPAASGIIQLAESGGNHRREDFSRHRNSHSASAHIGSAPPCFLKYYTGTFQR